MSEEASNFPGPFLPLGTYYVSNRGLPLVPSEPGKKISIPENPTVKQAWVLQKPDDFVEIPETHHYVLGTEDGLYLGITSVPRDDGPAPQAEGLTILPEWATTTPVKKEAWIFTLEPLLFTQGQDQTAEFPGPKKNQFKLVSSRGAQPTELTVVAPRSGLIGIAGNVVVANQSDSGDRSQWELDLVLRGPGYD